MSSEPAEGTIQHALLKACEKYDTNKTGQITFAQLKSSLASQGEEVSDADIEEMIQETKSQANGTDSTPAVLYKVFLQKMYADLAGDGAEEEA
jgi:Ca2+-binding EF-hand superfamily protein